MATSKKTAQIKLSDLVNSIRTELSKVVDEQSTGNNGFLPRTVEVETRVAVQKEPGRGKKMNLWVVDLTSDEEELEECKTIKIRLEMDRDNEDDFDDFVFGHDEPGPGELIPFSDH